MTWIRHLKGIFYLWKEIVKSGWHSSIPHSIDSCLPMVNAFSSAACQHFPLWSVQWENDAVRKTALNLNIIIYSRYKCLFRRKFHSIFKRLIITKFEPGWVEGAVVPRAPYTAQQITKTTVQATFIFYFNNELKL